MKKGKSYIFLMVLFLVALFLIVPTTSYKASAEEKVELVLWQHEPPAQRVAAWQAVIDRFMEQNPNISVTQELVLWEDQQAKMLSAINAGTAPDLNQVTQAKWSTFYEAGGLAPVDDIFAEIDASEGYFPLAKVYYADGHQWAIPYSVIAPSLMYRPSMLKAAGYTRPPKTWSELLEYAKNLTVDKDGDGNPDQYGIGLATSRGLLTALQFGSLLVTRDTDLFDEKGNVAFYNSDSVKTMEFYKELAKYAPPAASGWSWGEIEMNWAAGTFAMLIYPAPNLSKFFEAEDYDISTTKMVVPDERVNDYENSPRNISSHALVVTKNAVERGHYDAVAKLLKFMMEPKNLWILTICQEPGFFVPPTQTSVELLQSGYYEEELFPLKNFDFTEGSTQRNIVETFRNVVMETIKNGYPVGYKYGVVNLRAAEIDNSFVLSDMVQKACLQGVSADEAVKLAHEKMEELSSD